MYNLNIGYYRVQALLQEGIVSRPESIENRWDILYRDYPEVYEAFSSVPYHPTIYEKLPEIIDLHGKCIADIGAGTGSDFIREGLRVSKGQVVYVGIPPGWYGGDLYDVIEDPFKDIVDAEVDRIFLEEFQFAYKDIFSDQEYGTVEHIVSIYGFIFGKKAIEYLRKEEKTAIRWKFRVYWRA